jgi:putative endopeptidase
MRTRVFTLVAIPLAFVLVAAHGAARAQQQPGAPPSMSGIDPAAMDRSADACTDFYAFACAGWIGKHPLPPDRSSYGRFTELQERNNEILHQILEKASANATDADARKSGDYYASCMDEAGIAAKGLASLKDDLDRIGSLKAPADLAPVVAAMHTKGVGVFFGFGSTPDFKDASHVIAAADQGGLGLPDRDYYVKDDANSQKLRKDYRDHVQRMLQLGGTNPSGAAAGADAVMRIETALAKAALELVSRRDPAKVYHKMPVTELRALTPGFDWSVYLGALRAPPIKDLNVAEPEFMKAVNGIVTATGVADLRAYMQWHLLNASAEFLPKAFVDENFAFTKVLTGAKEQRLRWKRCVDYTDADLGEVVGKVYVAQTFGSEGKARTLQMVGAIERAMDKDIQTITWMSDETKKQALVKLKAVANKIGYPDRWRDYSLLQIVRGDALGNSQRANAFEFRRQLGKIGKPVDKSEWGMTPPTVNAYYNPLENNINFPAGILQPPFFNNAADDAVNFGAAGAVVGHELTHGFDDEGRQFDADGNLRDWWTAADAQAFEERAACVANQYSGYTAVADVKLNGRLTLGENAADNGGLRLGWMALMESLAIKKLDVADGFTPQQRFFLAWGQLWCENRTDEIARVYAATNPHSPGRYRVNGVVSNFPEFQKAFNCPAGSPMVNSPVCRVW